MNDLQPIEVNGIGTFNPLRQPAALAQSNQDLNPIQTLTGVGETVVQWRQRCDRARAAFISPSDQSVADIDPRFAPWMMRQPWLTSSLAQTKPAAVLILLSTHNPWSLGAATDSELVLSQIWLTARSPRLSRHSAQISLPGGRIDSHDESVVAAALRETNEELGVPASAIEILGPLPASVTRTGYCIFPVLAWLRAPVIPQLNAAEVDYLFPLPLVQAFDLARYQYALTPFKRLQTRAAGGSLHSYFLPNPFEPQRKPLWGATLTTLRQWLGWVDATAAHRDDAKDRFH